MPLYEPTIQSRYAAVLLDTVRALAPTQLRPVLAAAGLSARRIRAPAGVLNMAEFDKLMRVCAQQLGRDDLGFEYGLRLGIEHHAALGLALRRCRTADALLRMMTRYWRLTSTCFSIRYRRAQGVGEVLFRPVAPMSALTLHIMEEMFAVSFQRDMMAMTGQRAGLSIFLSQPRPAHVERFRSLHPTRFSFAAESLPQVRCVLQPALLDCVLQHPDQGGDVPRHVQALEQASPVQTRQCAAYVKLILNEAEGVQPDAGAIAQWLNLTKRTLLRYLAAEGYSLRELGSTIRHRRACHMLTQSQQPIGQIAQRLGYTSVISFSTAFKRCAGIGPRAYRNGAHA
jgi:AraC-like DNA-binding protein